MLSLRMREWEQLTFERNRELRGFSFGYDERSRDLAEELTKAEILIVREMRQGLSVSSTSYVGSIRLGNLQVSIEPKIDVNVLLSLFRYTYNLRDLRLHLATDLDTRTNAFQDILIHQLCAEATELISRGLRREYTRVAEKLSIPKGRLNIQAIARQGGLSDVSLPVVHHPRLEDSLINQVLLAGLRFAIPHTNDLVMRARLRRLTQILEATVARVDLNFVTMKRVRQQMSRLTAHYEPSITLIELLLQSTGLSLTATPEQIRLPGFLFDMNRFFERLITRFLSEHMPAYTLHDQFRLKNMISYVPGRNPRQRRAPTPRPDIVVTRASNVLAILDTKYRDLWNKPLPRDMLYQLAIYALSQGWNGQATILYPSVSDDPEPQLIGIRNSLNTANLAQIVLKPVNLTRLSHLLERPGAASRREREEYANELVFS